MSTDFATTASAAIARVRRDRVLAGALRVLLVAVMAAGFILSGTGRSNLGSAIMLGVIALLFFLAARSVRTQRQVAQVGGLIDAGRFDEAETELSAGLKSFMLYRAPRLGLLQNLAALRHAQHRYREAALLAAELLKHIRTASGHRRTLQLMLADCALETNDLPTVHMALSQIDPAMPVREMLKLMELQITYCIRTGAWMQALDQLPTKIELAELMPGDLAAHVQAMLALAALKINRPDWTAWFKRRVELLTDPHRLIARYSYLRELA